MPPKRKFSDKFGFYKSRRLNQNPQKQLTLNEKRAQKLLAYSVPHNPNQANWNEFALGQGMWHVGPGNTVLDMPTSFHPVEFAAWLHDVGYSVLLKRYSLKQVYLAYNSADERMVQRLENETDFMSMFVKRVWQIKKSLSNTYFDLTGDDPRWEDIQATREEITAAERLRLVPLEEKDFIDDNGTYVDAKGTHHVGFVDEYGNHRLPARYYSKWERYIEWVTKKVKHQIGDVGTLHTNKLSEWNNTNFNAAPWGQRTNHQATFI